MTVFEILLLFSIFEVKVGTEVTTGTGPNKKIAKRNAAEAMLLQLGYKASTLLQEQPDKVRYGEKRNATHYVNTSILCSRAKVCVTCLCHCITVKCLFLGEKNQMITYV